MFLLRWQRARIKGLSRLSLKYFSGSNRGTCKPRLNDFEALTDARFQSFFDVANFESSIPQDIDFDAKKKLYTYQKAGSDLYPPHLNIIPLSDQVNLLEIFNFMNLLDTGTLLIRIIPEDIVDFAHGHPESSTLKGIEDRQKILRQEKRDIYNMPNIGDRDDWYTDAVFAQQSFTGNNPTTIKRASATWMQRFMTAAEVQSKTKLVQLFKATNHSEFFIQDCSYFREALGVAPSDNIMSEDGQRFMCSSVTLYRLQNGKLHPMAVIIDYKTSLEDSVFIFNRRLSPADSTATEATDWPWRYAKMCSQVSDWLRHEVTVHLTHCHFVEEATIVAAHRSLPTTHPVYRLLQPHWLKTLSLNASARSTLVPQVIVKIVGCTEGQLFDFIQNAYSTFDWPAHYIPTDLSNRGFEPTKLSDLQFKNYGYGRNIILMWDALHTFVSSILKLQYKSDASVVADTAIAAWSVEMQSPSGGALPSFPDIKTLDQLIDTVTMCIHIASPQHTAVNYLQEYYQSFLPNKPSALYRSLPTTLAELESITEKDIIASLPTQHPREWLLATHLPHLLSMNVAEEQNLLNYAVSLSKLAVQKKEVEVAEAATTLYQTLVGLIGTFGKHNGELDDKKLNYDVLNPVLTAISILT